jgi:Sulfatase
MSDEPQRPEPQAPPSAPKARPADYVRDTLIVLALWLGLSFWLHVRYPPSDYVRYLVPSAEILVVFGLLTLARVAGLQLRRWVFVVVGLVVLAVRLFLVADDVSRSYLFRDFRVPLDFYLLPEFARLMYDTNTTGKLGGYVAALIAVLGGSLALVAWSLDRVHRLAQRQTFQHAVVGLLVVMGATVALRKAGGPAVYSGAVTQRVVREVKRVRRLPRQREDILRAIADVDRRIGHGKHFDKLEGNNVLFIFVESYGRTSFVHPRHRELLMPRYQEMEKNLQEAGFHVASNYLTSPTYGGFSWFAHGTLATGVKVISHLHSQLLDEQKPPTLADRFREAGYLPILVAPGTSRRWPGMDDHYGFHKHYYAWEFDYRGPRYAWGTMADQFVFNYVHKREIARRQQPLFVQYALVSSHAPFSDVPRYIDDWSRLGYGGILDRVGRDNFATSWGDPGQLAEGYSASIAYDLKVIENYLTQFIKDDSLVIFMGDHQPHAGVTGTQNMTWSVPAHVVSRRADFVEPFVKRGYTPGMVPEQPLPHAGMERFMEEILSDFSTEPLAVDPGVWSPNRPRPGDEDDTP